MNLLIFGSPIAEFPTLPEIEHAFVWVDSSKDPASDQFDLQSFLTLAAAEGVSVSIFTQDAGCLTEEVLDQVQAVEISGPNTTNKTTALELPSGDSIACLAWDGSDEQYRLLEFLQSRDITVLDMNDGFAEMRIGETPDFDHLVEQITERVLKIVRAEIKDMLSQPRRLRRAPLKP